MFLERPHTRLASSGTLAAALALVLALFGGVLLLIPGTAQAQSSATGAATNVRVEPNNHLGLSVWWDAPASLPAGMTVSGYYVEYKQVWFGTTWTRAITGHNAMDEPTRLALPATSRSLHNATLPSTGIGLLDPTRDYHVRVVTELTDGATTPTKTLVHSAPSDHVRPLNDIQGWFIENTPSVNTFIDRVFYFVRTNVGNGSGKCRLNGEVSGNCVPESLVSRDVTDGTSYTVGADITTGEDEDTISGRFPTIAGIVGGVARSSPPLYALTSGGDGRLLVRWEPQTNDPAGWTIQVRSSVGGSAWSEWDDTEVGGAKREVIIDVPNGHHQVRVRGRDASGNLGYYQTLTGITDNQGYALGIPTSGYQRGVPGPVTLSNVLNGLREETHQVGGVDRKRLVVSWDEPAQGGRDVYGYRIRHWATGMTEWQEQEHYSRKMWRSCPGSANPCTNPRTVTISNLDPNAEYAVQVAAVNVNGVGRWTDVAVSASAPSPVAGQIAGVTAEKDILKVNLAGERGGCPGAGAWSVSGIGIRTRHVTCEGRTVRLPLERRARIGESLTLSYRKDVAHINGSLLTVGGKQLEGFSGLPVANMTRPVHVENAEKVDANSLVVEFSEVLTQSALSRNSAPLPDPSAFTVRAERGGVTRTVALADDPLSVLGTQLRIALAEGVTGATVTLSYAKPADNPLRSTTRWGAEGNDVASFTDLPVRDISHRKVIWEGTLTPKETPPRNSVRGCSRVYGYGPCIEEAAPGKTRLEPDTVFYHRGVKYSIMEIHNQWSGHSQGWVLWLSLDKPMPANWHLLVDDVPHCVETSTQPRPSSTARWNAGDLGWSESSPVSLKLTTAPSGAAWTCAPPAQQAVFEGAAVAEERLTLTFGASEGNVELDPTSVPAPGDFHVTVNGARRNVADGGVVVSGDAVTLTLASAVAQGDTVKVRYTRPASNPLQSISVGAVATFADQDVMTSALTSVEAGPSGLSAESIPPVEPESSPATVVDADSVSVTAVAVTSDAGSDDTYAKDDVIRVTVTFSEAVDVTGTPQIAIDMDPAEWGTKQAAYESGSGTASLVFAHTVVEPNISTQGIAVLANTLALNGGTIQSSADVDADLAHTGLAHDSSHKVDWRLVQGAPVVSAVAVTSDAGGDNTYARDDVIQITVTFSEAVDVDTTNGSPEIAIDMDPAEWGTKWASYQSGSGTTTLTFTHTVVEPNISTQGIAVLANTLKLNGGTIQSGSDADANLPHTGLAHDANHKVDWRESGTPGI